MSKLRYIPYAVLSALILAAGSASAQTWYDARQERLNDRIDAGRSDGSLTRQEARRLESGMDRIESYERRAERDGTVSAHERRRLDQMLDRQGRAVHRERTDNQGRDLDGRNGWGRGHDGWRNSHWRQDGNDGRHDGRHDGWRGDGRHQGWDRDRDGRGWDNHNHGGSHAGINQRQEWQDRRISHGVRNGSITGNERNRLERRETRIDNYETRARADGNLSGHERHRLNGMLDRQSRAINHVRNNDRVTTPAPTTPTRVANRPSSNGSRNVSGGRNGGGRDR